MNRQSLNLYSCGDRLRTVIKTNHGRILYLELQQTEHNMSIRACFYVDRERSGKTPAVPKKIKTLRFPSDQLLGVIAQELDRYYYGIRYVEDDAELSRKDFISQRLAGFRKGYKFLIFVGYGELADGLPQILKTRLSNRIHRRIYLELHYDKDGMGIITDCHYYDRAYRFRSSVTPPMLSAVYIQYDRSSILGMVNRQLDCDFTDVIIIEDTIHFDTSSAALCGNI